MPRSGPLFIPTTAGTLIGAVPAATTWIVHSFVAVNLTGGALLVRLGIDTASTAADSETWRQFWVPADGEFEWEGSLEMVATERVYGSTTLANAVTLTATSVVV